MIRNTMMIVHIFTNAFYGGVFGSILLLNKKPNMCSSTPSMWFNGVFRYSYAVNKW